MNRLLLASLGLALAVIVGAKLVSMRTSQPAFAREAPVTTPAAPAIDPNAVMRGAPRDLPTETWNPI